jgi:DNA-binding transcriptional MerR regulator
MIKAGEVSKRLKVHANTIRNWADEYSTFMSPDALGKSPGGKRRFTEDDLRILATVAELRNQGIGSDKIRDALASGRRADIIPPLPSPEEESARQSIALIPLPEYTRILDLLKSREEELARVIAERDAALKDKDIFSERIADLQREIGLIEGELNVLKTERLSTPVLLRLAAVSCWGYCTLGAGQGDSGCNGLSRTVTTATQISS